jgi:(E)-4-hydroxy-3-methylbut-2-enyl-diphosphate synthase
VAVQFGSLLCDGIGDAVALRSNLLRGDELNLLYNILQATRYRMTKTEFISCPSCGRTLFDLEEVTAKSKPEPHISKA